MKKEAEVRKKRLRGDLEQLRIQQEQTPGIFDTRTDVMMERRTQAIMDRLDGLLGTRTGTRNRGAHSGGASREPRKNFNEHSNIGRTYGSKRGRLTHTATPLGTTNRQYHED